MKLKFSLFLVLLFFIPSLACGSFTTNSVRGSGKIVTQSFDVSGFDQVTLEGIGDVYIEEGQSESLTVEADDNLIYLLDIRVSGNELKLGMERGYDLNPSKSIVYKLTVQNLNKVSLAGSGSFEVNPLNTSKLGLSVLGSGDIHVKSLAADELSVDLYGSGNISVSDLNVKMIDTDLNGSGNVQLAGEANTQQVKVLGSGNYQAGDLEAETADVSIPGSANVTVWATKELQARISGSGSVQYYGNPVVDQSISSSGSVIALGEK